MLRTSLIRRIVALGLGAFAAVTLTLWAQINAREAQANLTQLHAMRLAAIEFEVRLDQLGLELHRLLRNRDASSRGQDLSRQFEVSQLALRTLVRTGVALTADDAGELERMHAERGALVAEFLVQDEIERLLIARLRPHDRAGVQQALDAVSRAKIALLERNDELYDLTDGILEDRLKPELEARYQAGNAAEIRAQNVMTGCVALTVAMLCVAVGSMLALRRRLDTGLMPLLQVAERVGAGDMTSEVQTHAVPDEFHRVAQSLLRMRTSLNQNTVSLSRVQTILDLLGGLRVAIGADGLIQEVSAGAQAALGEGSTRLVGRPVGELFSNGIDFPTLLQLTEQGLLHRQHWAWRRTDATTFAVVVTSLKLGAELLLFAKPAGSEAVASHWSAQEYGVLLVDGSGVVQQANPAAIAMLGDGESALTGTALARLFEAAHADRLMDVDMAAYSVQYAMPIELAIEHPQRGELHLRVSVTRLPASADGGEKFALRLDDVSELHRSQEEVRRLAYFDGLTGLPNRSRLIQFLEDGIRFAQRRGEKLALLFIDLDGFKDVNDSLGHDQGDVLLQAVGQRLQAVVRDVDMVARLGGDEFCLLLTGLRDEQSIVAIATRCLDTLLVPVDLSEESVAVRGSIGIAVYPNDAADAGGLLKAADMAMYAAKRAGKHRYAYFDPRLSSELDARLSLEIALRGAVERNELGLQYQPKVSLTNGRMLGVEALARWMRPGFGPVRPDEFIAVAQRIGLIEKLGVWVLETACAQAVQWRSAAPQPAGRGGGARPFTMAVNISPSHFEATGFVASVARVLHDCGLPPECLEIEVTESISRNPKRHSAICSDLKALGVRVAIDDFGTGYSSLSVLKHMSIDTLKLDRQFIQDVVADSGSAVMIGTIIGMASGLNFEVVAEGVETLEQVQILVGLGCPAAQGYYFSRPVNAEQIPALARTDFASRRANTAPPSHQPKSDEVTG